MVLTQPKAVFKSLSLVLVVGDEAFLGSRTHETHFTG